MKLRSIILLALLMCVWGCSKSLDIPLTDPVVIEASPEQIYQKSLNALRPILAPHTKIMREDSETGIIFRFSSKPGETKEIRLVKVAVKPEGTDSSRITVHCEKYSLTGSARREAVDVELEQAIIRLLK